MSQRCNGFLRFSEFEDPAWEFFLPFQSVGKSLPDSHFSTFLHTRDFHALWYTSHFDFSTPYSSLNHRRNPRPQKVKSYGVIEALSWSILLIFVIVALSILDLTLMLCPFMGVKIPLNSSSISVHLLTSHQYFTSSQTTKRKILFIVFLQLFKEREKKENP